MDTTFFYKVDEDVMKGINGYLEGNSNDLSDIISYIEYSKYLQEIHQWFEIFNYSLNNLKEVTDIHKGAIEINAFLINVLASGKNIVENIENYLKYIFGEESEIFNEFRTNYTSYEYDHNFSYKFLYKLRNYSQHGHIPVSVVDGNARFDLKQIYYTPHYKFNPSLRNDVDNFIQFVENHNPEGLEGPYLDFRYTVSSYAVSLFRIYKKYVDIMTTSILELKQKVITIANENEELLNHKKVECRGWMFFIVNDQYPEHLQAINTEDNIEKMLTDYKNQVAILIKNEKNILKEMKKLCIRIE